MNNNTNEAYRQTTDRGSVEHLTTAKAVVRAVQAHGRLVDVPPLDMGVQEVLPDGTVIRLEPEDPDVMAFLEKASYVRAVAEIFLLQEFGPQCPDFVNGCPCCDRWRLLDKLIEPVERSKVSEERSK